MSRNVKQIVAAALTTGGLVVAVLNASSAPLPEWNGGSVEPSSHIAAPMPIWDGG